MIRRLHALLFTNQTTGQTIVKNTFWMVGGEVVARVIRATIVIYAARLLGASEYGAFSYAMAIAGFVTLFSDIGISQILTREIARDQHNRGQYFSTALTIKVCLILVNIFLVLFVAPLFTKIETALALLPLIALVMTFDALREFGFAVFRAMEKMEREALVKIIMNSAIAAFGFMYIIRAATAYSLAQAYALGAGIGFLVTLIILWPHIRKIFKSFNRSLVKTIIVAAWPMGLLALLGTIMINTDMIMLGWMRTPHEVGLYAAAQKPVQLLYMLPALLASAFFPAMARLAGQDNARFRHILERGIRATLMLGIPMMIGGVVLSKDLIQLMYGAEYAGATSAFAILLLTLLVVFPTAMLNNSILAFNKQRSFLWFFTIGAVSNIILNAIFIPRYGIEGAAWATLGSQLFSTFLIFRAMQKINPFHSFIQGTRFFIASCGMGTLTFVMNAAGVNLIVNLFASMLCYFILLILLREPLIKEAKGIL